MNFIVVLFILESVNSLLPVSSQYVAIVTMQTLRHLVLC
jgi:hypothetical protein